MTFIPFNKPYLTGKELDFVNEALKAGKLSGNGMFTQLCHRFFEQKYLFKKVLLTSSCTDALEMSALLVNIRPGDEVIVPSYTFVSSALAFIRQGAKIVFADSCMEHPNMDTSKLESLISFRTKAIVVVHYAGVACDMDFIMTLAEKNQIFVIEDAAQSFDSFYKDKPLGGIGHFGCFSFHETKNIQCGEGGMLVVNDERFIKRAEIIWEKGTNRAEFFRGEISKYAWVDTGSSFLPSEITAAFLFAQLENSANIQAKRRLLWDYYYDSLLPLAQHGFFILPTFPEYASNNAHLFYLICPSFWDRNRLISALKNGGVIAVFHYLSLHSSPYYHHHYEGEELPYADYYSDCLVRLPLYYELTFSDIDMIVDVIRNIYIPQPNAETIDHYDQLQ